MGCIFNEIHGRDRALIRPYATLGSMHNGYIYNNDSEEWLWVIRIYQSTEYVRFTRVQNRTQEMVKLVLNKYVQIESHSWTDSFNSAFSCWNIDP